MKKLFLMMMALGAMTLVSCNSKTTGSTAASDEQNDSAATEQTDQAENGMQKGSKGPGTLEAANFSIDVPEGWEVTTKTDDELAVRPEGGKVFSFQYSDQANYDQEKQIMMDKNGMEDLGEKQFGDNTYNLYMWKQDTDNTFKALLKVGDGTAGSLKVTCSGLEDANSEVVGQILGNVKMK